MARASTKTSQVSTRLEVVPLQRLMKIMMEDFVALNGSITTDNCVNTRYSSATASCHNCTLPTPSSGGGLRVSALGTGRTREKIQLVSQLSTFEHSIVLVLTGEQARLISHPIGAYDFNNCANSRYNSVTTSCQSSTMQTSNWGSGFRGSATTIGCTRKESQIP